MRFWIGATLMALALPLSCRAGELFYPYDFYHEDVSAELKLDRETRVKIKAIVADLDARNNERHKGYDAAARARGGERAWFVPLDAKADAATTAKIAKLLTLKQKGPVTGRLPTTPTVVRDKEGPASRQNCRAFPSGYFAP